MKIKIIIAWIAFLIGTLSTLHAQQRLVVIGEVKNIEEGTVFNLEETSGTGSSRSYSIHDPEDNGKVINGRFVLSYKSRNPTSRHFALYSESPGFTSWVKLDFWANQGDTVYVKGNGKILGNWEVRTKAPESSELRLRADTWTSLRSQPLPLEYAFCPAHYTAHR